MATDRTQHQSTGELRQSRDLSLEPTRPPAEVPGYNIKSFVGSGAFGEVWSAIDQKTGRHVAIKFYSRREATEIEQLAREVQKLAVLGADRYVVQLLDVGWNANPPYFVMDYIESGSLEDRLKKQKTLPTNEAVELFSEIANGMMHLHGKGILHCDLKPGNILLDQDGKPRVADFGQSRLQDDDTPSLGTLFYMAPEQADMKAIPDARWDVYALGALLFSMLVGKPPYYSKETADNIEGTDNFARRLETYQQSLQLAATPTEHRKVAGVDRQLAEIIERCIDADPKKRYASIQSVMLALRQRELMRARRPLLLLGLIGPFLLMGVFALFGLSAYNRAVTDTEAVVKTRAIESKEFAAQFAARSAANQIDEYFRVVDQLSRDETFLGVFAKVKDDPDLKVILSNLSDPNQNSEKALDELRNEFIANTVRQELNPFLVKRMHDKLGDFPAAASWLVYDRAGNQLAALFDVPPANNTIGKNYSYRSYFTGANRDLKKMENGVEFYDVSESPEQRKILNGITLSATFKSKANGNLKIAFSAPIYLNNQIEGIVAATVEMGNFVEFTNDLKQYVTLVDSRPGDDTGVILEHPLYDKYIDPKDGKKKERIPEELTKLIRFDFEAVKNFVFEDPFAKSKFGSEYAGQSLVAQAPVESRRLQLAEKPSAQSSERKPTGLVVFALEDLNSALEPVHVLSSKLGFLAIIAAGFLLAVAVAMWLLVMRMLRDSKQRLARVFAPSSDTNSLSENQVIGSGTVRPDAATLPHDTNPDQ